MNTVIQPLNLLLPPPLLAHAQVNSGSDGHDGAFNPTATNTVIDMADHPDGIYHFTSAEIPAGVDADFRKADSNGGPDKVLEDLPVGAAVKIKMRAVNETGPGAFGDTVEVKA